MKKNGDHGWLLIIEEWAISDGNELPIVGIGIAALQSRRWRSGQSEVPRVTGVGRVHPQNRPGLGLVGPTVLATRQRGRGITVRWSYGRNGLAPHDQRILP